MKIMHERDIPKSCLVCNFRGTDVLNGMKVWRCMNVKTPYRLVSYYSDTRAPSCPLDTDEYRIIREGK